ncbi:MAG: toxin-antitoxin system YwqK family antitoxin [Bacteroidales bacterium]|nr:toxin-antitoxin system YwqK family antitoxin [Bacteroidales bacterium]
MRIIGVVILILTINKFVFSQNVGQPWEEDSVINYIDINGMRQGWWVRKYDKDKIAYVAYFKDNKIVGEYKRWYKSGALKARILYNKDGSVGYAELYWDNGKIMAKGKYINQNIKDSVWEFYGTDGYLMVKENYRNGVLEGKSISYYRNKEHSPVRVAIYKNGKLNGIYREYFENKLVKLEITYINGVRNGPITVYYDNGKKYIEGYYKNDLPEGKWIKYDRNGNIEKEYKYVKGELENQQEVDREFARQVKEWDKMKGKIPEPRPEDFFKDNFNPYINE